MTILHPFGTASVLKIKGAEGRVLSAQGSGWNTDCS